MQSSSGQKKFQEHELPAEAPAGELEPVAYFYGAMPTGVTVSQSLRVGALDGLHLAIRNDISLFHSEFEYSAFNGQAQIPVADRGWLVLQGGGGSVGYGFFEVGGKALLVGNGAPGSLFVRGTIGYATLFEDRGILSLPSSNGFFEDDVNHAGPLVGLGIEWRM